MPIDSYPRLLYKYLAPERVDVIERAMWRYTPLGAFNDPFEGRPDITIIATEEMLHAKLLASLPDHAKQAYEDLDPRIKAAIPFDLYMSKFLKEAEDQKGVFFQVLHDLTPSLKKDLVDRLCLEVGALCLSEVPDSLLMWSHYTASHAGFVLELDSSHPYFHAQRSSDDEFQHLRRVLYRETRPSGPLGELDGSDVFLVKSTHWGYEREWRVLGALSEADQVIPSALGPVHLFSFPRGILKGVILGTRISEQTEGSIRAVLRSHEEYAGVQLKRANPDEAHFLLRINPVI